jgi:hypothetical protein
MNRGTIQSDVAGQTGGRVTTKIHPFWNVYLKGLPIAGAEKYCDFFLILSFFVLIVS